MAEQVIVPTRSSYEPEWSTGTEKGLEAVEMLAFMNEQYMCFSSLGALFVGCETAFSFQMSY